jgi:hypothetical protein
VRTLHTLPVLGVPQNQFHQLQALFKNVLEQHNRFRRFSLELLELV